MTPLDYLNDAPFECSPEDADVAAFIKTTFIISGRDAVEEFLAYGIWPPSNSCNFEVEIRETPLSKVVVPIRRSLRLLG
jgi:hypothetical protein